MGRRKKAVVRGRDAINKQRDEKHNQTQEEIKGKKGKISKEEYEKRIKKLKEGG